MKKRPKFSYGDYVYVWFDPKDGKLSKDKTEECNIRITGVIIKTPFKPFDDAYYLIAHNDGFSLIGKDKLNLLLLPQTK